MNVRKEFFGNLDDGRAVTRFVLENGLGLKISAMDFGANLLSVIMPDRTGDPGEMTLGFDTLEGYKGDHPYFGATVGRYANRISGARFTIDGHDYPLYSDDDGIHLHGGKEGFDRRMWDAEIEADGDRGVIRFHRLSPSGEENYPGNLDTTVSFVLTEQNELIFEYEATTDSATPINLTNHTYWNLSRPGTPVRDHLVMIQADRFLAIDDQLLPTGELTGVADSAFDFREEKPIGRDIDTAGGYDHCFVLMGQSGVLRRAATVKVPSTGRCMVVDTTQAAVQLYTSNMLDDTSGRGGVVYRKHGALCVETGGYNDAVNVPAFPGSVLRPEDVYRHTTRHTFWTE